MSPHEIKNQFGDYSSKYFGEFTRSIIYSQPPAMIELSFCPKTLWGCEGLWPEWEHLCSRACLALPLLVDRKFSSGAPSEAGGGQHCWLNSQHSSGWWWRSSQHTKPKLHHQWLVVRGICSEFNKPNCCFRFAAASAKYLSMHIAHCTDMISAFIYVLSLGCTKWWPG